MRCSHKDNSKFQTPNPWNWNLELSATFQIPFHSHSIVVVTNLFTMLFNSSSIPIPQWMEWNVESRFDTGCCLELLFARTMGLNSADRTRALCGSKKCPKSILPYTCIMLCTPRQNWFSVDNSKKYV